MKFAKEVRFSGLDQNLAFVSIYFINFQIVNLVRQALDGKAKLVVDLHQVIVGHRLPPQ
jgi:hypothetical protein